MNLHNLAPHPLLLSDLSEPRSSSGRAALDNSDMKHSKTDSDGFAILATLTLFLAAFAALASCSSGGGAAAPKPVPTYQADEPNDSWHSANVVPSHCDDLYLVEGNIHHGDIDHIACNLPSPAEEHLVDVSVDYAAGWDMEVQIGWIDAFGNVTSLWGGYDEAGLGNMSTQVLVPQEAAWIALTIQQTQYPAPGQTRYTFTVEIL